MLIERIITFVFSSGLIINAMLFVPQAYKLLKQKSAKGLSLFTFIGFCVTQLAAVFYGLLKDDAVLVYGYFLSLMTCGTVTFLIFKYRKQ